MSRGRRDWAIISTRAATSPRSGSGAFRSWLVARAWREEQERFSCQGINWYSISTLGAVTFFRKSMSTGPGRPVAATAKACRITSGMVLGSRTR